MNQSLSQFSLSIRHNFARAGIALLLFLGTLLPAAAEGNSAVFNAANSLYEQQKFTEAAAAYENLLAGGTISAPLFFNLGNAHFQVGQFGKAIAAYRQAQKLAPRDPDIRANLRFARNKVQNSGSVVPAESWVNRLRASEWALLASVPFSICFLLLAFGEIRPDWQKIVRGYAMILGVGAMIIGIGAVVATKRELTRSAVVVADEAVVRHGPFNESQSAFSLRQGAELTVLDERENWIQISAGPQRLGWVPRNRVTVIN